MLKPFDSILLQHTQPVHSGKSGIGARGIEIVNFTTPRTISRHADGISRYSVPPSAGPLLPLPVQNIPLFKL